MLYGDSPLKWQILRSECFSTELAGPGLHESYFRIKIKILLLSIICSPISSLFKFEITVLQLYWNQTTMTTHL